MVATLTELRGLMVGSVRLLVRFLPQLLFWFCAGWTVHEVGIVGSVLLGADHAALATALFIAGVIGYAAALVIMLHSVEPGLSTLGALQPSPGEIAPVLGGVIVPELVFKRESRAAVLALALSPFLAVYTLWGLADAEVAELFLTNILIYGLAGVSEWSVNLGNNLNLYAGIAVGAWLIKQALRVITRRLPNRPALGLVITLADAVFTFAIFMALLRLTGRVVEWVSTRAAWVGIADGWNAFLGWLPDLRLPFDLTLPEALRRLGSWTVNDLLPGIAGNVLLPLMWLALAAIVFGWREFSANQVLSGTAQERPYVSWRGRSVLDRNSPPARIFGWLTVDLRTKYLPLVQALRMIWHAGPHFLGAYLVAAALVRALEAGFGLGLTLLYGPRSTTETIPVLPAFDLVTGAVFTCWSVALYAVAFDRGVADVIGRSTGSDWAAASASAPPATR